MSGFKQFLLRGNVIDLAVAVIIGAAFSGVVSSFVKDLLTPLIAAIGGQPDFSALHFAINGSRFMYGTFLNAVIAFVINGTVIYFGIVYPLGRFMAHGQVSVTAPAPTVRSCPECLSEIPFRARRCAFCTSVVDAV